MDGADSYQFTLADGSYINSIGTSLLLDTNGNNLFLKQPPATESSVKGILPLDSSWLKQSFMVAVPNNTLGQLVGSLSDQDKLNRTFSSASLKYTDSSLGGNTCINPPPQFTRYADIRDPGIHIGGGKVSINPVKKFSSLGMGRYYSEAIDDNSQIIHLRFGVASYNSLAQFFTGFYSGDLASAARSGRFTDNIVQNFFSFAGNLVGLAISPLFIIPLAILLLGSAARYFANWPSSKFYTMKPTMSLYWNAVTSLVNQLAVNSGLSSFVNTNQSAAVLKGGDGTTLPANSTMNMVGHFLPPGLIKSDGTIDVYAMANRASRLAIDYDKLLAKAFDKAGANDNYFATLRSFIATSKTNPFNATQPNLAVYLSNFINGVEGKVQSIFNKADKDSDTVESDFRASGTQDIDGNFQAPDPAGLFDFLNANFNDGSEFATFRVDYTGSATESFSSSVSESSLASKINGMSSSNREIRMNVADGNFGGGLGTLTDAVKGFVGGVAEVVHIDGLAALAGSAFVDIPKHWDTSSATLNKSNYSMTLISPYGNPVSQLFNIWVPLAMLLAGTLPLATGKQSHTSPYLCELHDRGRTITRCGIIDSLTITRGTSNLGFNNDTRALAVEVSFSVLDMSSIVAMPIQPGFSINATLGAMFDGDNSFTDYLMSLSSIKLADTIYRVPMLKYQINRAAADMSSFFSASHFASYMAGVPGVKLLSAAYRGVDMP